jgi:uncharacterized protein
VIAHAPRPRDRAMPLVLAAAAGALFGAGLLIAGMTQPLKVLAFLDAGHRWDPSLAFVMMGAVGVYGLAYHKLRRTRPWFDGLFHLPTRRDLDAPLVVGSAIFGVGWGVGGICPGPAMVQMGAGTETGLAFAGAMIVVMLLQHSSARR